MTVLEKDPKAILDYTVRWSDWLNSGDMITGSSWLAADNNPTGTVGLVHLAAQNSFTTGSATIWLASGTIDHTYRFDNIIGTLGGRQNSQSILIEVKDK